MATVDYDAIAKRFGGVDAAPQSPSKLVDYDAIAKRFGGVDAAPDPSLTDKIVAVANNAAGSFEPLAKMASGALAYPVSRLAGLGAGVADMVAGRALGGMNAQDVQDKVEQAMTYHPVTQAGQSPSNPLNAATSLAGRGIAAMQPPAPADPTSLGGMVTNAYREAIPNALGILGTKYAPELGQAAGNVANTALAPVRNAAAQAVQEAATTNALNAPKAAMVNTAIDAGLKLPPAAINPSFLNRALEGFAGKRNTQIALSLHDSPKVNQMVREGFGLPEDAPLTPETYQGVIKNALDTGYEPLKQAGTFVPKTDYFDALDKIKATTEQDYGPTTSNPDIEAMVNGLRVPQMPAADAVYLLRTLRANAGTNLGPAVTSTAQRALGNAQAEAANAIDGMVGRSLEQMNLEHPGQGFGDMLQNFNDARTTIAQVHNAQQATNLVGNVDTTKLAAQLKKAADAGQPYTGPLRTAAEFGTIANGAAKIPEKIDIAAAPHNQTLTAAALGLLAEGGSSMMGLGHGVGATLAAATIGLPFARGGARALIQSGPYQRAFARMPQAQAPLWARGVNSVLGEDPIALSRLLNPNNP